MPPKVSSACCSDQTLGGRLIALRLQRARERQTALAAARLVLGKIGADDLRVPLVVPQRSFGASLQHADAGPGRVVVDEGRIALERGGAVGAAQIDPLHQLERGRIGDRLFQLVGVADLALAEQFERFLGGRDIGGRSRRSDRVGERGPSQDRLRIRARQHHCARHLRAGRLRRVRSRTREWQPLGGARPGNQLGGRRAPLGDRLPGSLPADCLCGNRLGGGRDGLHRLGCRRLRRCGFRRRVGGRRLLGGGRLLVGAFLAGLCNRLLGLSLGRGGQRAGECDRGCEGDCDRPGAIENWHHHPVPRGTHVAHRPIGRSATRDCLEGFAPVPVYEALTRAIPTILCDRGKSGAGMERIFPYPAGKSVILFILPDRALSGLRLGRPGRQPSEQMIANIRFFDWTFITVRVSI
jgi:hypothetical protein